ncbi:hypothetical protein JHK85_053752 [Glycine max]|nr:hypothetical protein JHK85_053752 [Glycine max]
MVMKEVEEMIEEVQNELKNVSYLESGLRHEAINWLTENPNNRLLRVESMSRVYESSLWNSHESALLSQCPMAATQEVSAP